jgi:hypothetical protein
MSHDAVVAVRVPCMAIPATTNGRDEPAGGGHGDSVAVAHGGARGHRPPQRVSEVEDVGSGASRSWSSTDNAPMKMMRAERPLDPSRPYPLAH